MSDDEQKADGKGAGGHIAIAIAAIGAFIARGADDCGRLALKGGAAFGDDAARGASRVGSLADDGVRGGSKLGSFADDGMRTGKFAPIAEDGMHTGKFVPHAEPKAGLVEEAVKVESHAGDVAEFGVDVSFEVIQNVSPAEDEEGEDDAAETPAENAVTTVTAKPDPIAMLERRSMVYKPAILPLMPTSSTAFEATFGRPKKPSDRNAFALFKPSPDSVPSSLEKMNWHVHNPIALLFYTPDASGKKDPIPLVMPDGSKTDDSAIHRTCLQHSAHCIILVCTSSSFDEKAYCASAALITWQTLTIDVKSTPVQTLLAGLMDTRAKRSLLRPLTISRIDLSTGAPRVVRSRLSPKARPE